MPLISDTEKEDGQQSKPLGPWNKEQTTLRKSIGHYDCITK
jgi:hypothetical protein